jgi:hypothetical protein
MAPKACGTLTSSEFGPWAKLRANLALVMPAARLGPHLVASLRRADLPGRDPRLARDQQLLQRAHRSHQPTQQEDQAGRPRLPQLHQPPATAIAALRRHLEDSPNREIARLLPTLGGVEQEAPCGVMPRSRLQRFPDRALLLVSTTARGRG